MAKKHKIYDDDDGRTIADMSGIERQPMIIPKLPRKDEKTAQNESESDNAYDFQLSKGERRAFIGGALGAVLAVVSVFIIAAFLLIFLITRLH